MYYKVRIKSLPKAKVGYQVDGSLSNDVLSFGDSKAKPDLIKSKYITAVPRKEANLEAEGGETVYGDLNGDNFPEHKIIKGPRHSNGGVPLKLPDDTFIFSDTAGMKINDPIILRMFGKLSKKGKGNKGFTPASLAKQYDIDSYRKILQDPNSDAISIKTAELMIKNYNMKLGALALAQEAKKGFPQGIPTVAESYMEMMGIDPKDILPPELPEPMSPEQLNQGDMQEQPIEEDPTSDQMANDDTLTQSPPNLEQYAQPDESQMGQEESFANPDEMMQYGGMRRLRRAQEGMQQMSEEEMMALQQEQAQLQANQQMSGQNEGMMQEEPQIDEEKIQLITQQVEQALQQGAPPEEVVTQLLKAQVPPDLIEEIFVELGMPQQEVKQLLMSLIQNVENEQAQQIDPRQQQQMSEEDMMAMQQQDPRQMQEAPMAAYGMSMGGYEMPYAENGYSYSDEDKTEMSEDTNPCPPCPDGSVPVRTDSGDCPCSDVKENLKFYNFALKERDSIMNQPAMWNEDPDMMNPDGSYKFCVDCLVKDYNDPDVVKSVSALINDGIANFPKYDYPDLIKGLEKFNLPMPVYQSNIKKSKGGVSNSRPLSMAQYGMDMGGYDMPFTDNSYEMAFGGQRKFNKDHVTVLKFQGGGQPPDGKIIKRSDYQTDELYKAAVKREMYNNRATGVKVYTQNKDGKYSSVSEKLDDGSGYTGDMKNWNGNTGAASRFASMQKSLSDPVVAKLFAQSTREAIKNKESYKKKGAGNRYNTTWEEEGYGNPDDLKDEEIVKSFLEHQERNLKLQASGNEAFLYNDANGKLRKKNGTGSGDNLGFVELMQGMIKKDGSRMYTDAEIESKYKDMSTNAPTLDKAFENIGLPLTAVSSGNSPANKKARLQQATFIGYDNLIKKKKAGTLTPDETYLLDEWEGNLERGYNDEKLGNSNSISPAEGIYTNTTAGQISNKTQKSFEEKLLPEDCFCKVDGKEVPGKTNPNYDASKPTSSTNDPCAPCSETPDKPNEECQCEDESKAGYQPKDEDGNCTCTPPDQEDKWWLQDNINVMGAASDLASIKKYLPWAPRVDLEEPRPTFLDPTRELAAQSEQANIASQASASFAGAQGLGARNAATQGNAAAQAANILSSINNQNVNIGNQFEDKQVNVRNQESIANQQIATQMYDKNTIANQQFDNAKLALRGNLRKQYNNALTNKANTAMLNGLYPNQAVRPEDGGMPKAKDSGRELDGTRTSNNFDAYLEECRTAFPSGTPAEITACIKQKTNMSGNTTTNPGGLVNSYPGSGKYGGQQPVKQFKYGGFIYNVYPDY